MKIPNLKGNFRTYWYDYPRATGPYGSGGWSRNARHRPQPVIVIKNVDGKEITFNGKSAVIDGIRKLKCTIIRVSTGEVIRDDYGIERIKNDLLSNSTSSITLEPQEEEAATLTVPVFGVLGNRKLA